MNSTNNTQKSEFQDKGGGETDKVKENILETLAGIKTVVVIRARIETIKGGGGGGKGQGMEKMGKGNI